MSEFSAELTEILGFNTTPNLDRAALVSRIKKCAKKWDLEGPITSGYLAHCSHPFFMSIRLEFSASYSMLCQSLVTPISLAKLFINPGLSVSSEALVPITAILIPAADCVLLLHQLVIGRVTVHLI